ncbi:carboxylate--amine ligase [Pseudoclavibacter caeni]|jgi:D-aspartate ligase|uniref:ATP-grasp domain-containing protein n=1 Tax=Pseudoclavibacter caeni TaxID=908846 RepID=A0A7C8FVL7_9MICO|nr:ATP-grasp domain-containing protein [Pseudoclavibacter caeni]KAB1633738.1 ATP-grasp domain-containing protein [Pseudoclavibacter caeni]NYJ96232.1 D-aspartate ligase [Pseudoclavibacter caeni]
MTAAPAFTPVILGSDICTYAMAREFDEAYGVRSIIASTAETGAIAHSRIVEHVTFTDDRDERALVAQLGRLADRHAGERLLLLANTDWRIRTLAVHREELEAHGYIVPVPPLEVIDLVADKVAFARRAEELGLAVPRTTVVDFAGADRPDWRPTPPPDDLGWPVIAKPAVSADYENLAFEGRKKVYRIGDRQELDDLWRRLREAGFRGTFVVQEMIPGDDTAMYSITAYVDRGGRTTLLSSAHVLLEEHHPATLGNPCAMITERHDEILEPARRFLEAVGYRGFANFDVKRDPRDGRWLFLEVNPRIGRNQFYVHAAGVNPMTVLVADQIEHRQAPLQVAAAERLYSIIPHRLLLRYLVDPALRAQVVRLQRGGRRVHPLRNARDRSPARTRYILLAMANQYRKFGAYYPRPSSDGF